MLQFSIALYSLREAQQIREGNTNCGIYCWTNLLNGKRYVGQTIDLKERKRQFTKFDKPYSGIRINNSRKKYNSIKYWTYSVLELTSPELLDKREIWYIKLFNSFNRTYGMNASEGGKGKKAPCSEEAKRKLREVNKGRFAGKNSVWYGKHHTKETKEKLRLSHLGKRMTLDGKRKKGRPIIQYDLQGNFVKYWYTIAEAAAFMEVTKSCIFRACKGESLTACGFQWRYVQNSALEQPRTVIQTNENHWLWKGVNQYDLDGNFIRFFKNVSEATLTGADRSAIIRVCKGKQRTAGGFRWQYSE